MRSVLRRTIATALLVGVGLVVFVPAGAGAATPGAADPASVVSAAARPTLKLGSTGSAVVTLQRRLATLHYDVGPADGVFGGRTFHAVVVFQKVNNLTRDGIVGPITWSRLDSPIVPRARYSHSGYSVEVNLTKQVLYLVRSGAIVRIVDASSGKSSTPTPTGNYRVTRQIDGWRTSSLGTLWRPKYFYGGYAIHGSSSVPNYPASHGCVRVTIGAMNRLWSLVVIGTPVHIYRT